MDAAEKLVHSNVDSPTPTAIVRDHYEIYDLVCRCLRADEGAWAELFDRYQAPLQARIRIYLGNRGRDANLVEEVAAEVWLGLLQRDGTLLRHFQHGSSFLAYLSSIARYKTLLHFRGTRRRRELSACGIELKLGDSVICSEYSEAELSEFLTTLTPREREFLDTLILPQESTPQLDMSPTNLWQLRHRVRRKLCDFLAS